MSDVRATVKARAFLASDPPVTTIVADGLSIVSDAVGVLRDAMDQQQTVLLGGGGRVIASERSTDVVEDGELVLAMYRQYLRAHGHRGHAIVLARAQSSLNTIRQLASEADTMRQSILNVVYPTLVGINEDKPHRCPRCHAITDTEGKARTGIVTCCTCGVRFTEHPERAAALPEHGIVCMDGHGGCEGRHMPETVEE